MTKSDYLKNILAFLCIIFGEDFIISSELMNKHPDYLIEKFERYILADRPESDFGMHPNLRCAVFNRYLEKWSVEQ